MPRKSLPRLVAVSLGERPFTLHLRWNNGDEGLVDVSGLIEIFRSEAGEHGDAGEPPISPQRPAPAGALARPPDNRQVMLNNLIHQKF